MGSNTRNDSGGSGERPRTSQNGTKDEKNRVPKMVRLIPITVFTILIAPSIVLGYLAIFGYHVTDTQVTGAGVLFMVSLLFGAIVLVVKDIPR